MPLPEKLATVSVALPSSLTLPVRSIFLPPAWVPTSWAEMSAFAEIELAGLVERDVRPRRWRLLGPTLMLPCTAAVTPVAAEATRLIEAPVTVTSPILAELAAAVSDSVGTPFSDGERARERRRGGW